MAVSHDVTTESHTGTTGHSGGASFDWNHAAGTPRGVVVFVFTISATKTVTGVTYAQGAEALAMTELPTLAAIDAATEVGRIDVFFLDDVPAGTKTIRVNRTNNAVVMTAVSVSLNAAGEIEAYLPTAVVQQGDGAIAQVNIDDRSPGSDSLRLAAAYTGAAAPATAGANSTIGGSLDFGAFGVSTARETTAGQGSRPVGLVAGSDDRAYVAFAVRERVFGSLRFDGNDRIQYPDAAALDALNLSKYLLLAWVRPEAGGNNNGRIFERGDTSAGSTSHMQLLIGNGTNGTRSGNFTCRQKSTGTAGTAASGTGVAPDDAWSLIGGHYDDAGSVSRWRLFEAGAEITPANETPATGTIDNESDQPVYIGNNGADDRPLMGRVAAIAVWDVDGLSSGQIDAIVSTMFAGGAGSDITIPEQARLAIFWRPKSDLDDDKGVLTGETGGAPWFETGPPVTYAALASGTVFDDTPAGGLVMGGTTTVSVARAVSPAGGLVLGGVAAGQIILPASAPAGGLVLGGTASSTIERGYTDAPTGGLVLGGTVAQAQTLVSAPAGGIVLGGTASSTRIVGVSPSSGLVLGGTASSSIIRATTPAGGIVLNGVATSELGVSGPTYNQTPAGGIVLGGTAATERAFEAAPAGGIVLGGTASTTRSFAASPTGGLVMGGVVSQTWAWTATRAGGIVLGGEAPSSLGNASSSSPTGGIVLGGSAVAELALTVTPAGGIRLGGTAAAALATSTTPAGGLTLGGSAIGALVFTSTPVGGIILDGTVEAPASRLTAVGVRALGGISTGTVSRGNLTTGIRSLGGIHVGVRGGA